MNDNYYTALAKKLDGMLTGKKKRRYPYDPARFDRLQELRRRPERARRLVWATLRGKVMSAAEFCALTGQTPEEAARAALRPHAARVKK